MLVLKCRIPNALAVSAQILRLLEVEYVSHITVKVISPILCNDVKIIATMALKEMVLTEKVKTIVKK